MKCKQRNRCNSNMMRVTSTLAIATGLLFPAPIAIQASGMQNAHISVQQDNVTTGRIIDENGEPLIGVTVRVLKGNTGTVTDIDGNYSLRVAKGTQLKITYTGYKDQIIRAGGTAQMQPDELNLNEVVVVGYGVQRKSDVTGALIRVGEKEMNERLWATPLKPCRARLPVWTSQATSDQEKSATSPCVVCAPSMPRTHHCMWWTEFH